MSAYNFAPQSDGHILQHPEWGTRHTPAPPDHKHKVQGSQKLPDFFIAVTGRSKMATAQCTLPQNNHPLKTLKWTPLSFPLLPPAAQKSIVSATGGTQGEEALNESQASGDALGLNPQLGIDIFQFPIIAGDLNLTPDLSVDNYQN